MRDEPLPELRPRQRDLLRRVVEAHISTGQPVGSKALVERFRLAVSPSTVRNELAELEALGFLTHPHTSAGRVPTEAGYRLYAAGLLDTLEPRPSEFPLDLRAVRNEVDSALRATTEMLSGITRLLALVSAPPLETATVRHVEVLLLQPEVAMIVVITSTGGVTKRVFAFADPVDPGLANWASEYLLDEIAGLQLGSHLMRRRFDDPSLSARERTFLAAVAPVFTDLVSSEEQRVYVGGTASLLEDVRPEELAACRHLLEVLERRAELFGLLGGTLGSRRPFVRVGTDLESRDLQHVSLVGASYGLANRTLGAVSLLGPVRMDYEKAIRSVRAAAHELSRFVEEVYEPG